MAHLKWVLGAGIALLLLPIFVAFLIPQHSLEAAPSVDNPFAPITKRQGDLVNTSVRASYDAPGVPMLGLIDALKTYPDARRFCASWSLLIFMNGMNTTVLYDRRDHTVTVFSYGGGDVVGSYQDHVKFTKVRESVFKEIAEAHKNGSEDMAAWSWFTDLPKHGCRKHDLGSWEKDPQGRTRRTP